MMKKFLLFLLIAVSVFGVEESNKEIDPDTGLIVSPNLDIIKGNCLACHSAQLIIGQRGDYDTWKSIIVWMQETQSLWEFDPETEKIILTYLSTNYPPEKASRRPNLNVKFLPPNPYNAK